MSINTKAVLRAYISAALWSSTDDTGEPLDDNYTVDDMAGVTIDKMRGRCGRLCV